MENVYGPLDVTAALLPEPHEQEVLTTQPDVLGNRKNIFPTSGLESQTAKPVALSQNPVRFPPGAGKVKVKVKLTLEQATKAHRGSRCIALLFL